MEKRQKERKIDIDRKRKEKESAEAIRGLKIKYVKLCETS